MNKNRKQLENSLEKIHRELEDAGKLNDHTVELLQKVQKDIEALLGERETQADDSVRDRLDRAVVQLDENHPELTASLRQIMQVLSNMGI